ncbi:MAG: hypothetical protein ACREL7_08445 [Longimicrobiales bacterium]
MHGTHKLSTRIRALALFGGAGLVALTMVRAQPASADLPQCAATLTPDSVSIGAEPVSVGYSLSEQIGVVGGISVDEGSGLQVASFNPDESTLELNTSSGIPGSWQVSFAGEEEKTCSGTVHVKAMR